MEVNVLSGTAPTPPVPRNERLSTPEPEPVQTPEPVATPTEPPPSEPPPSNSVQPSIETTDLNQLLLRNTGSNTDTDNNTETVNDIVEPTQDELAQQAIDGQNTNQEQRNQLQDRFDAINNDAPTPNIDVSA
ncbi:hypothetical protein HBA55_16240 [Pseudomaricurvus alkylphenolicus]|uniref:hypothetical protein n=1 Tax=Pseudomaricurvus alkylphenolicus TaxID=1306991 RepID=UPI00141F3B4C|nr:hypothetical protein [Pseudomaricurvus alkylphenolicus]NIB41154.1 hypothetical protein [Pseudomaricurvus alkylphenolicus]